MAGEQASDRILQGPDGVYSAQTARDMRIEIERISSTLKKFHQLIYSTGSLDLRALIT